MKNISAIVLAGGKSSRMKFNKEYIKIDGEFLVHKQIRELKKIFNEVIVVSNNIEHYKGLNIIVVSDILSGSTPIIGLHSGLFHSSNEYSYVIACDMPFINTSFIDYLVSKINGHDAYVSEYHNYIEPFNAIYSSKIISIIEDFLSNGNYGFQKMVRLLNTLYIPESKVSKYQEEQDMFKNINNESELYNSNNDRTSVYKNFEILKVIDKETFKVTDKIITEYPLNIFVNTFHYSTMMITPTDIEFLVVGALHSDMVIKDISEIKAFNLDLEAHRCEVFIDHEVDFKSSERLNILSSACGGTIIQNIDESKLPKVKKTNKFNIDSIFLHVSIFNKESVLFKETGGVHSVELVYSDKKVLFEDIGRHNAVDKIVGYLLKNQIKRDDVYIITSGRISSDILLKSALINIGLVVSRSAPTSLAVKLAEKLNITIVGFARGKKLNIYTHSDRLV